MSALVRVALTAALAAGAAVGLGAGAGGAAEPAASAFVPAGFEIERRLAADIGGDRRTDAVLVLRRSAPDGAPADDPPPLARRLVLLEARGGGYVRIGEGRRALLCTRCGGAFLGAAVTPVRVRVRAKVVIVEQEHGSRQLTRQRFRIRAEGPLGTRLIGVDVRVADRLTGAVVGRSTNLLTGDRVVTRTDVRGRRTVRRSRVPVRRIPLERVVRTAWR